MKSTKFRTQCQVIACLLIFNLSLSSVLCNLLPRYKRVHSRVSRSAALGLEPGEFPYETQVNNLRGKPGEGYYLEVEVGTPPQKFNVLIDTGSSNLAIACRPDENIDRFFNTHLSSSYVNSDTAVNVPYTEGSWDGVLGRDLVTIATLPNSTVTANIACINKAENFFINESNWQGIIGLGYADIARPDSSVEPYLDSLVQQKSMPDMFSVQLCGQGYTGNSGEKNVGGSLVFGSVAPPLYTGPLYGTPINKEWYYEVILVDIEVNGQSLGMDCKEYNFGKTILDTGTTNLRLPFRVFNQMISSIKHSLSTTNLTMPHESFWNGDEVLCWPTGTVPYSLFPTLSLTLPASQTAVFKLVIVPQQYLRPVGEEYDNEPGSDCFKLGISGLDTGSVLGAVVMQGFYVVFDRTNKQLQFAESTCEYLDSHAARPYIMGNIPYSGNFQDCAYKKPDTTNNTLTIVGYVLAGICGLCLLPLIFLIIQWQCRTSKCRRKRRSNSDSTDLMDAS